MFWLSQFFVQNKRTDTPYSVLTHVQIMLITKIIQLLYLHILIQLQTLG